MLSGADNLGYLRYPTIAGDLIVFVAEDDLWSVEVGGGPARRLTTTLSSVGGPFLSADGGQIAFVAREEGAREVYCVESAGGVPRQLTHLVAWTSTSGWSPDGRVIVCSDARAPFAGASEAYLVPLGGGEPERLALGVVDRLLYVPGGRMLIGRHLGDPARWKRYRGGTAGEFWVDLEGRGAFVPWGGPTAAISSPMWVGDRLYFLSDHEGVGNLYSARLDGGDVRRHTDHAEYYARNAQSDGRRIVYHCAGDIYCHDPETDQTAPVPIELRSQRTQRARRFVSAARYLDSADLHPKGHSLLITTRGRAFAFGNWEGPVLPAGEPHGVRYRLAAWLPDGERAVMVADAGGEEALEVHRVAPGEDGLLAGAPLRRLADLDIGRAFDLIVAPMGERIAIANHRNEILMVDLAAGTLERVDHSPFGRAAGMSWSPDGQWLCYALPDSRSTTNLRLWRPRREGEDAVSPMAITQPVLHDVSPAFDPEGKYIFFLSYRTFDPVHDNLQFDLGFPRGVRPYLLTLQRDLRSPLLPEPRPLGEASGASGGRRREEKAGEPAGAREDKEDESAEGEGAKRDGDQPEPVRIDLEGIGDRVVALPVPDGRYGDLVAMRGKVLWTSWPVEGSLGRRRGAAEPRGSVEAFDLKELRSETLARGVRRVALSLDARTMLLRTGQRLRVLVAGRKAEDGDEPGRKSGWIDLERVRVAVDPPREWAQMLREAWRLQRDNFWTADLSGVDWLAVWERYRRLLPRIATRGDLSDLMWEMQGEFGTSHAYEMGGDYRGSPNYGYGFLGADLSWDPEAEGYRIDRILRGDPWDEDAASPLQAPGARIAEGDVVLGIDGRRVAVDNPVAELLIGKARAEVALLVRSPGGDKSRTVVVRALDGERRLRYRQWVEDNRARVHAASGGRIGYVHIPDMGPRGYAEFHRAWLSEARREGLIVDVRHNGGGNVSQLILEKLARKPLGYVVTRWGVPAPYPQEAIAGPMVALCDEYAGSDGDIFSHAFKLLKLGPLVGKRTWGGVIGIWVRHALVDGTHTSQPEFAHWFHDVGWGVENYGTDPDIPVAIRPQDAAQGLDPQLERGLAEAQAWLAEQPAGLPDFGPRPNRALPVLPPRA